MWLPWRPGLARVPLLQVTRISFISIPTLVKDPILRDPAVIGAHVTQRRFRTTNQRISDQLLDAYDAGTGGGVVSCSGIAPQLRTAWRQSFIDPCGLGTLMPEEETESQEEVRSQRRRSLPNVDE